jgi:hypothetical protein
MHASTPNFGSDNIDHSILTVQTIQCLHSMLINSILFVTMT